MQHPPAMPSERHKLHKKPRILYVEDDSDKLEAVINILSEAHFHIESARNGVEALNIIRTTGTPDLVITDWIMPVMDGRELLHTLKSAHPKLPVLIASAAGSFRDAEALMKIGADGLLQVPFEIDEVLAKIEKTLALTDQATEEISQKSHAFIGSSTEGLPLAYAIQAELEHSLATSIWSQGIFGLGDSTLESLLKNIPRFDYAIIALTPDDMLTSRKRRRLVPRDNVMLELGICLGVLGRFRTLIIHSREFDLKLPSDLAGITVATYAPHPGNNLRAAIGPAVNQIRSRVSELGRR